MILSVASPKDFKTRARSDRGSNNDCAKMATWESGAASDSERRARDESV